MSAALPPLPATPSMWEYDYDIDSFKPAYSEAQMQTYAQQARADLEAENKRLREALSDIKHGLEGARVWGGMDWTYNPLHPFKYQPLIAKAAAALKEQP